jgi:hypothetical protein
VSGITVPQFPDTTTKSKVTTGTIQANQSQMNDINSKESHDSLGALLLPIVIQIITCWISGKELNKLKCPDYLLGSR